MMEHRRGVPQDLLPVVLVGMPGAGKTSVSRHLATALNVAVVDSDSEVKRRARATIPEIFARVGEEGFRELEYRAIAQCLNEAHGVIALGGGAVTYPPTLELLREPTVIYLRASVSELAKRLDAETGRPLLDGQVADRLAQLATERAALYEEVADIIVDTDGLTIPEVARQVHIALAEYAADQAIARTPTTTVTVSGDPQYHVLIGRGVTAELAALIPDNVGKVFVIHPKVLAPVVKDLQSLIGPREIVSFTHPDAEAAKTIAVANECWESLGSHGFGREDLVIGLGGGASTDLAGFVASTWLRGIRVIQMPTTLLAMVDAAVGGKTGVNSLAGKNLVGTFYPPLAVLADTQRLDTLPEEQLIAGAAEIVKCGWIRDPKILELFRGFGGITLLHPNLREAIERAIAVKAAVVSSDLREAGLREILNYGHTGAHAIEKLSDYTVSHGEAVAIGMQFAAHVGNGLGIVPSQQLEAQRRLLTEMGLPCKWENSFSSRDAIAVMRSDKKVRANEIRMVFVSQPGQTTVVPVTDTSLLAAAWEAIRR